MTRAVRRNGVETLNAWDEQLYTAQNKSYPHNKNASFKCSLITPTTATVQSDFPKRKKITTQNTYLRFSRNSNRAERTATVQ